MTRKEKDMSHERRVCSRSHCNSKSTSLGVHPIVEKMQIGKKRGIPYRKRVMVTGDTGFLGHHVVPVLEDFYDNLAGEVIRTQGSKLVDFTQQAMAAKFFEFMRHQGTIHHVVHLAALSGGIQDNRLRQADYFYQNMMILLNVISRCGPATGTEKILLFMGGCSYPNSAISPIKEEDLWEGLPVETSLGYSMAKKMGLIAAFAYAQQFKMDITVLIPTNLVGEWDNFHPERSHVVPALIQRFAEAKEEGYNVVTVWGSGKPIRDFIYAGDVAKLIPYFLNNYPKNIGPVNISTGKGTSIAELAEMIAKSVGFTGKISYDVSKPDGQAVKILDNTKLLHFLDEENIKWSPTPLDEAIGLTVEWFYKRVWKK